LFPDVDDLSRDDDRARGFGVDFWIGSRILPGHGNQLQLVLEPAA
jgi:hypothetical protein